MSKVGILGAGSWGIALAKLLCENKAEVSIWTYHAEKLEEYKQTRKFSKLDCELPESLIYEPELEKLCRDKDILIAAVPSVNVRATVRAAAGFIPDGQIIVSVSKGIELETLMTLTDVIEDELKAAGKTARTVALSGPTLAAEVVRNLPSTIVSASNDREAAEFVQDIFMCKSMRVYTNDDITGVELCGAMKNVIAIASGICRGLGFGDNSRAALITRGLAEMTRLGLAMGCRKETFMGLAGMGDLIVTTTSEHSRNNSAGYLIGQGCTAEEAKTKVGMVVEGINALKPMLKLAAKYGVELPICKSVDDIINGGKDVQETVYALMMRDKKNETA